MTRLGGWPERDSDGASRGNCLLTFLKNWKRVGKERQIDSNAQMTPRGKALKTLGRSDQLGSSIHGGGQPGNSIVQFKVKTHRPALRREEETRSNKGGKCLERVKGGTWN